MTLASGTRLGPYEVLSPLGAGGMGEVYRARDTRLDRTVALKVLPTHLAANPERRQRFEREAKAISALNHPHICVLHDVGRHDGIDFLVMELLDGQTLADRLKKGALPLEQVLRHGIEIADALHAAHKQGIVHRDLKPANVMLTKSGAKLLDFGLAKLRAPAPGTSEASALGTNARADPLTAEGAILGTCQYMAPEQLVGKEPDARSDIFTLGAVLYEMATGRRAFDGGSQPFLVAASLGSNPAFISSVQQLTPPGLDHVVATCLAMDPDERWQSAHDVASELKWIAEAGSQAGVPAPILTRRRRREWLAWIAALLGPLLGYVVAHRRATPDEPRQVRFEISPPENVSFSEGSLAVSPDGRSIAFAGTSENGRHVYLRPLSSPTATKVAGTENAIFPFWSADGRQIGFVDQRTGRMKKVDLSGGPAVTLHATGGAYAYAGASWSGEGLIIFSLRSWLFLQSASGSEAKGVAKYADGETGRFWPQFLPDGRHYLYLSRADKLENAGIYVASLDSSERKRIVASDSKAEYSPTGHLLFVRGGSLMAQAFDAAKLELSGEAFSVTERLALFAGQFQGAAYSVSSSGVLAWRTGAGSTSTQLTWMERSGKTLGTVGEPAEYTNPALSPDERSLAVARVDPQSQTRDVWVFDLVRGNSSRLTFDPGDDFNPTWLPDGTRIAFNSARRGIREIYWKLANGSGDDELLLESKDWAKNVEDVSADGKLLLYNYSRGGAPSDLMLLSLTGDRRTIPFVASEFVERDGQFSPDDRWIAYCSNESGTDEVYVQRVSPDGVRGQGKWQVSTAGGVEPQWRRDGKELFFLSGSTLVSVDVKTDGGTFEAGVPKPLFATRWQPGVRRNRFVLTRDGSRFLVVAALEQTSEVPIQVLVNWLPSKR